MCTDGDDSDSKHHLSPNNTIIAHQQLERLSLKAAISICSMYSVLQSTCMKLNYTLAVFQTSWSYFVELSIFFLLHKSTHTTRYPLILHINNNHNRLASSHTHLYQNVRLSFLYFEQIKGKDIVNVHLYHSVTYVYTFLKTSPVFPLYRPLTVW